MPATPDRPPSASLPAPRHPRRPANLGPVLLLLASLALGHCADAQTQLFRFPAPDRRPATYALGDSLGPLIHGFAVLQVGQGYCYVDATGRIVIPARGGRPFEEARAFGPNGLAAAQTGGKFGFLSRTGEWVVPPKFDAVGDYGDSAFVLVSVADRWGMLDRTGREFIPPTYVRVANYSDEAFGLSDGTGWALAGARGQVLTPFHFDDLGNMLPPLATGRQGRVAARQGDYWGFVDLQTGKLAVPAKYDEVGRFSEGFAAVRLGSKIGYVDRDGRVLVAPAFDSSDEFSDGMAAVRVDRRWGYIDRAGRLAIAAAFESAGRFERGVAQVRKSADVWVHINRRGEEVPKPSPVPPASEPSAAVAEFAALQPETVQEPLRCTVRYDHLNLGLDFRWDGKDRATHVRAFVLETGRTLMWDGRVTNGLAHGGFLLVNGQVVVLDPRQGLRFSAWNRDIAAAVAARDKARASPPPFDPSERGRKSVIAALKAIHADITLADQQADELETLRFTFDHSAADEIEATLNRLEKARAYADVIKALTGKIDRALAELPALNEEQRQLLDGIRTSRAAQVQKLLALK